MPTYDFRCAGCRKSFSLVMTYEEYDSKRVRCPKCKKSKGVERVFSTVFAKTSKKS